MITRLTYDVENLSRPQARHHPESHQARLECPALVLTSTTVLSQWRRDTGTCWTLRTETRQRWVACLCWWTVSTCPGCSACTCARDGAGARCRFRSACADARSTARSPDCSSSKHSLEPFFDSLQEKQKSQNSKERSKGQNAKHGGGTHGIRHEVQLSWIVSVSGRQQLQDSVDKSRANLSRCKICKIIMYSYKEEFENFWTTLTR